MQNLQSAAGIAAIIIFAFIISENRRAVSLRQAAIGLVVTFLLALLLLKVPQVKVAFVWINAAVDAIAAATRAGTSLRVRLYRRRGVAVRAENTGRRFHPGLPGAAGGAGDERAVLAAVPLAHPAADRARVFVGAGADVEVGGAVGLSTAANIFLGMVEAPLFIRPYLAKLSRGEMFMVMTGGMAGIAGTVLVLYATILVPVIPDAAGHIVVASVLGAPAAILISLIMVPDSGERAPAARSATSRMAACSTMDAIVKGTGAGLELLLNIVAMLIVLVALVHLANAILGLLPDFGGAPVSLQRMLGWIMAPVCWLMGVPWSEAVTAGGLMGIKTILNELMAYLELCGAAARRARSALAADHALRDVRLRQFRLARHHDRAGSPPWSGEARGGDFARLEVDRLGHAVDVPARRDRRRVELTTRPAARTAPHTERHRDMNAKSYAAEAIGTFWLTFGGCGSAVIAAGFPQLGIGFLGVALAFGLTLVTMAYAIGHVSGCHINPAVTVGLMAGGRFPAGQVIPYVIAQLIGAIVAAALLYLIASGAPGFDLAKGFATNGYGDAFTRPLQPAFGIRNRSRDDDDVFVHHHGVDARQGAGGFRAARHRARAYADPSREHPGHQHLGQSGAQYGPGLVRRRRGADATLAVLGCAFDRRNSRRRHLSLAQQRT